MLRPEQVHSHKEDSCDLEGSTMCGAYACTDSILDTLKSASSVALG